jgi:hypothetical protein
MAELNKTELKDKLREVGFTYFKDETCRSDFEKEQFYACKQIAEELPLCKCNDKNPQFVVHYSDWEINGYRRQSITVDLTAEGDNRLWFQLRVYGLDVDEYFEKRKEIERKLIAAWVAVNC